MDVDGPGTTEEVITPHLLQQLGPGEHPAGVLSQVLQQFELLVGQVQWAAPQARGVGAFVDDEFAQAHFAQILLIGQPAASAHQQTQAGIDLGRTGSRKEDLVDAPIHVHRDQATLVDHGDDGHRGAG